MKALVIGSGGREAMLVQKLAELRSSYFGPIGSVHITPGNGGTLPEHDASHIPVDRASNYLNFLAMTSEYDIIISGSENDLVPNEKFAEDHAEAAKKYGSVGLGDLVRHYGKHFFGVNGRAAMLEGSKMIARSFMSMNGIPHPDPAYFDPNSSAVTDTMISSHVEEFLRSYDGVVVKVDGLAGGKGVRVFPLQTSIPHSRDEVMQHIRPLAEKRVPFLLEEMVTGVEISATAVVGEDGNYALLPFSQDHKPAYDGDRGPNTGGMGALTLDVPAAFERRVREEVIEPTIHGAIAEGRSLEGGVLYAGLMVTEQGDIKVLEYNCRFGDPETQVILAPVRNTGELLWRAATGSLKNFELDMNNKHYATVVLAAAGYPGDHRASEGKPIFGLDEAMLEDDVVVTIAGTEHQGDQIVVKGSRNLNITGRGRTPEEAINRAYRGVRHIESSGLFHRSDIGLNYQRTMEILQEAR